jgi:SOS-response transcriptional repressor LexA
MESEIKQRIADSLNRLIKERQIKSSREIAEKLGVSRQNVDLWRASGSMSLEALDKIARFFNVRIGEFLGEVKPAEAPAAPVRQSIPLLSWVQAGSWSDTGDINYDQTLSLDFPQPCFALQVKGDSMTSQTGGRSILDGSFVIVRPCSLPVQDLHRKVVVAMDGDGDTTIKELWLDGTKPELRPWNRDYEKIPVTPDVKIVGIVIACLNYLG